MVLLFLFIRAFSVRIRKKSFGTDSMTQPSSSLLLNKFSDKKLGFVLEKKVVEKGYTATVFCLQEGICMGLMDKNQFDQVAVGSFYRCDLFFTGRYQLGLWTFYQEDFSTEQWRQDFYARTILESFCQFCLYFLQEYIPYDKIFSVFYYCFQNQPPAFHPSEWKAFYFQLETEILLLLKKHNDQNIAQEKIAHYPQSAKKIPCRFLIEQWS